MNGVQTEALTSPRAKDALRYSPYVNILFQFNVYFFSSCFYFIEKIKISRIME